MTLDTARGVLTVGDNSVELTKMKRVFYPIC